VIKLLEGVRVLESAVLFTGDHLGTLLGDLGADVIKVERPPAGDYIRDFLGQIEPHYSPAHVQVNKNKRSVVLDLRRPEGRAVFWKLLATADVFLDGAAGDATARLGIGYDEQRKHKPDIIYCQISGYGAAGPYAPIPTHGQMMNALAGGLPQAVGPDGLCRRDVGALTNFASTQSGGEGTAVGGIWAAYAVAAALFHRARTGEGCAIDVSASDAVVASAWIGATYGLNAARITDQSTLPSFEAAQAKYQFYETQDGKFVLFCAIEEKFWRNFCRAAEREDLSDVMVTTTGPVDFAADDALRRELAHLFRMKTQAEWVKLAVEHDIALGPAYNAVHEVAADPHVSRRGIFHPAHHPLAGEFIYIGEPMIIRGQPYEVQRPAPALGQHTLEVLSEIGLLPQELEVLERDGIIAG
jgi:crotonobetainyl-CoA:carnitine CoA-transferase CaiB-like acyl-CoA transferase